MCVRVRVCGRVRVCTYACPRTCQTVSVGVCAGERVCVCVCVCVGCTCVRFHEHIWHFHHSTTHRSCTTKNVHAHAHSRARARSLSPPHPSPRNLPRCVGEESAQALLSSFGGCVSALEMRFRCYDPVVHAHWRRSIRNGQDHLLAHEQLTCCKMWRLPIC